MMNFPAIHRVIATGAMLLLFGSWNAQGQESDGVPSELERNPARITLSRDHPDFFAGGRQIDVTVRINASRWEGLTAMGLYEQIPPGWTFAGARAGGGPMPGVLPPEGTGGVLQFVWIDQSRTPIAFQYTLNVPPKDHGSRVFSGQVEYRLNAGQLTSNVALSRVEGEADDDPVITLLGAATMTLAINANFQDPGARATDKEDGDLTNKIETSGQVDTTEPGTYTITYGVMDSVGNRAEPAVRRITVRAAGGDSGEEKPGAGNPGPVDGRDIPQTGRRSKDDAVRGASEATRADKSIQVPNISLGAARGEIGSPDSEPATDEMTDRVAQHVTTGGDPTLGVIATGGTTAQNVGGNPVVPDTDAAPIRRQVHGAIPVVATLGCLGAVAIAFRWRWRAVSIRRHRR